LVSSAHRLVSIAHRLVSIADHLVSSADHLVSSVHQLLSSAARIIWWVCASFGEQCASFGEQCGSLSSSTGRLLHSFNRKVCLPTVQFPVGGRTTAVSCSVCRLPTVIQADAMRVNNVQVSPLHDRLAATGHRASATQVNRIVVRTSDVQLEIRVSRFSVPQHIAQLKVLLGGVYCRTSFKISRLLLQHWDVL
jgi:hypothetical protein